MKRIFNIGAICLTLAVATLMTSCSDQFIEDKKNYSNASSEVYDYYSGANGRLNECYRITLPNIQAGGGQIWQYNSLGMADNHSQSTEEYRGFSTFVNPQVTMNTITGTNGAPGYFGSSWARIREINETIAGIQNGSLSDEEKDQLLGQAIFLRAWCYYLLFRYYGSVPIVTEVQKPVPESFTPRSTAKEVYEFICSELDKAAEMLRKKTVEGAWAATDWGRVTTGTCLAFKHRMMILWASPLFNRANDKTRWTNAYETIKKELPTINACGYGLANENDPGKNGSGWAKMFLQIVGNPEAVFVSCYNMKTPDLTPDYQRNNLWEQQIRPANTLGNNGKTPADMIVDLFPMKDGKRPSTYDSYTKLEASSIAYDAEHPFMNRDPRFYRTFAFPGVYWRFDGDPNTSTSTNPYTGGKYILWNYVWYNDKVNYNNPMNSDHFGADNLFTSVHGMYIRKFSDDLDVNSGKNYNFNTGGKNVGFRECMTSTMEIRYAEVLLNLAEAACQSGNLSEAVDILKRIRARVGYTSENNYGLSANLSSDEAACMAAILYERQIEFAYEGKRFEDMRRWLLFDGGKDFAAAGCKPLTGWGGNTCTYLGFKPFAGQRRDEFVFRLQDKYNYTDGTSGRTWKMPESDYKRDSLDARDWIEKKDDFNPDPIIKLMTRAERDAYAVDLSESIEGHKESLDVQLEKLKEFYDTYLTRKKIKGDAYSSDNTPLFMTWNPRYYIWGLSQAEQIANPDLPQTVGWEDYYKGGSNGTYDPLTAEPAGTTKTE